MSGRRFYRFAKEIIDRTLFLQLVSVPGVFWLAFSAAMFVAERGIEDGPILTFGDALYRGIAASSSSLARRAVSALRPLDSGASST